MEMIYYKGYPIPPQTPKKIDLSKETILSYEVKKLEGWNSPNLVIVFNDRTFEIPTPLIENYEQVIKYLKSNKNK